MGKKNKEPPVDCAAALCERLAEQGGGAPPEVDAVVALQVGEAGPRHIATLVIGDGNARLQAPSPHQAPDATFIFDSANTALGVLTGEADPFQAFLAGRFRADAHLPLVFVVLGLFRRAPSGALEFATQTLGVIRAARSRGPARCRPR